MMMLWKSSLPLPDLPLPILDLGIYNISESVIFKHSCTHKRFLLCLTLIKSREFEERMHRLKHVPFWQLGQMMVAVAGIGGSMS